MSSRVKLPIQFKSVEIPNKSAKRLKRQLELCDQGEISLGRARTTLARLVGYRDWEHLKNEGISDQPSPLDHELDMEDLYDRRQRQVTDLVRELRISELDAAYVVGLSEPTGYCSGFTRYISEDDRVIIPIYDFIKFKVGVEAFNSLRAGNSLEFVGEGFGEIWNSLLEEAPLPEVSLSKHGYVKLGIGDDFTGGAAELEYAREARILDTVSGEVSRQVFGAEEPSHIKVSIGVLSYGSTAEKAWRQMRFLELLSAFVALDALFIAHHCAKSARSNRPGITLNILFDNPEDIDQKFLAEMLQDKINSFLDLDGDDEEGEFSNFRIEKLVLGSMDDW
nr:hypothetical protein [Neorhizobium tomejilense]